MLSVCLPIDTTRAFFIIGLLTMAFVGRKVTATKSGNVSGFGNHACFFDLRCRSVHSQPHRGATAGVQQRRGKVNSSRT